MRSPERAGIARRVRVAASALGIVLLLLAARATQLAVLDQRGADRGDSQARAVLRVAAARGEILDRRERTLALTMPAPSIFAAPREIEDTDGVVRALAPILGVPAERLEKRLRRRSAFVYLARWVGEEQAAAVRALDLPGLGSVEEPRRVYPLGALAGPVLGFSNIDGAGVRGVEQSEDAWLRGRPRRLAAERDARRRLLATGGVDPRSAAGGDVALTLDAAFQADAEQALAEAVAAHGAVGGSIVSLDPRTGELLAIAQQPAFDPNRFREVAYVDTRSRALLDAVEPGSTLKPFLVAAALEAGVIGPSEVIDCGEGWLRVPGKTIRDLRAHGELDVAGVLRVSSNVGAVKIGYRLGAESHHEMLRRFGFGAPTGSGFPDESAGLLRAAHRWRPVDHANVAFGQGISVTPLQLAAALGALADDGLWRVPRLVAARREPGGDWQPVEAPPPRRVMRGEVAAAVLGMLEQAAGPEGTGRRAALRGVPVAGKTGTAQKLDPETGRYSDERYLAWFAGAVPADDPRLVVVVMLDEPRGEAHTGGAVAAPVFARVAAAQLARLGVATSPALPETRMARREVREAPAPGTPPLPSVSASEGGAPEPAPPNRHVEIARMGDRLLLPDFRGLRPDEVERITEGLAFVVEMVGEGRAVAQEPAPGTVVAARGARLHLRFEQVDAGGEPAGDEG